MIPGELFSAPGEIEINAAVDFLTTGRAVRSNAEIALYRRRDARRYKVG